MIRPLRIGLILVIGLVCGHAPAEAQYNGLLSDPGDYSLAPSGPGPAPGPGGVASVSAGSRNMRSTSIRMDSGLIGNTGVRGFVALEAGQGPDLWRTPQGGKVGVTSHGAEVGLEKSFADGTVLSLDTGWQRDSLTSRHPSPSGSGQALLP